MTKERQCSRLVFGASAQVAWRLTYCVRQRTVRQNTGKGSDMNFVAVDYWAIVIAGIVGYAAGSIWYWALGKPWMAAVGLSARTPSGRPMPPSSAWPSVVAFVADLVMAAVLAAIIGATGATAVTLHGGIVTAALVWLGFVLTTMAVNNSFARRKPILLAIDGGHWLVVLILMGGIIGGLGVK